jgi:hypothetical protein
MSDVRHAIDAMQDKKVSIILEVIGGGTTSLALDPAS